MLDIAAAGKNRRTRQSPAGFASLPELAPTQRAVLLRWLRSDAAERKWQGLLELAGKDHLDLAEPLLHALLEAGALTVKEEFLHGQWRTYGIVWRDLPQVQRAAGLKAADERAADKLDLLGRLELLAQGHPELAAAVLSCRAAGLPRTSLAARSELLQALALWKDGQRDGTRRDFSLAARGHTKAITAAEWDWLDGCVALEALGVARFEPVLWLGGSLGLVGEDHRLDLRATSFTGLPCRQFAAPLTIDPGPREYWLIENRASFERQARQIERGVCLIWLPGRPGADWLAAVEWLIGLAPAPARISCDPDPAGLQIALTAGQLWTQAGLPWQTDRMAQTFWQGGSTQALNAYDRRVLAELQAQPDLPDDIRQLRDFLMAHERKAEQEGWL